MKHTRITTLVVVAVLSAAAAAFIEVALAKNGLPIFRLYITYGITLAVIGGIVISMAMPIRRMTRTTSAPRVDPFYATRVVMLAKACAITGALGVGVGAGVLAYLLTRSIVGAGSIVQAVVTIVGAGILLAAGLLAERMCSIPPSDDDNEAGKDPVQA